MNYKDTVIIKLNDYDKIHIILTNHAKIQAEYRHISIDDIINNILEPKRLYYAGKQETDNDNEEKYDCYFGYSNTQCQRYILVLNKNCVVCTVIKVNRRWQKEVEKRYGKL
ncbi:MAG: hypothetical protein KAI18_04495 [Candidatus Aenigmarchaeota archaeon]|nr:hypothetical protein [Candidatus Aenigmarchaeota archaeon]